MVDIPGIGYAKVPLVEKSKWARFFEVRYWAGRLGWANGSLDRPSHVSRRSPLPPFSCAYANPQRHHPAGLSGGPRDAARRVPPHRLEARAPQAGHHGARASRHRDDGGRLIDDTRHRRAPRLSGFNPP